MNKNLFDKNNVVTGKYMRYRDGTIITLASYSLHFMPCKPNTEYAKKYSYQFCYLDANKQFISGVQAEYRFTTPSNCYYVAINCENATLDTMQVELGSNITDYEPYQVLLPASKLSYDDIPAEDIKGLIIVDINGKGHFTSIQEAVDNTTGDIAILVMEGTYHESLKIHATTRKISIRGTSKYQCIVRDDSGDYYKARLDCNGNLTIENISFLATAEDGTPYTLPAYAVHIDHLGGAGITHFKSCVMTSYVNAAVGIGLRQDQTVILEDCVLRKNAERETGSLYAHNAQASDVTNQHKHCDITTSHGFVAKIDDANVYNGGTNSQTDMLFVGNNFYSDTKGRNNPIWFRDAPVNGGISGQIKLLTEYYGNIISVLNA